MSVRSHVTPYWNVGRGRRSKFTGKDVMFMVLVVLKNGGAWEMLSNIFHVKTATFIKTITNFVRVVAPRLYDEWVKEKAREESMRMLVTSGRTSGRTFVHHPADQLPHRILPLRATNGEEYNQRQNRLIAIGREKQKKWRLAQERERERRRLRQRMSLDDRADGDSSCEEDILTQL
ncbi:hypothetical protein PF005_g6051 [Phytophthora fragariae]|uniref:Uncharacterized protein n=1 Tax=Phytophthora fragariae TaxID=53985 RepID=A0A6A3U6C9_9STRA|nr:hypothetical protein PF007_g3722 [Phytophthora fragariae]KAE9146955.1 hypothetical protein PF006_g8324 [Phytophthora fragariae]KAE9224047.1 hypothetical protein PF005_g6051 [Phytophthora fragariae]